MRRFFRCTLRQSLLLLLALGLLLAVVAPWARRASSQHAQERANQLLLDSAEAGDVEAVAGALASGASLIAWDERRCSALGFAIQNGNLPLVDLLLDAGADPDMNCRGDVPPLAVAARFNHPAIAARLLKAGAANGRDQATQWCVIKGHPETLQALLAGRPGSKLLAVAMDSDLEHDRKLAMVRLLLELGAPPDQPGSSNPIYAGALPLDRALSKPDGALVDLLCEFGAPYTAREAVMLGRADEVRHMVEDDPRLLQQRFPPYAHIESPERYPTLLGLALRNGRRDIARFLIDSGAPLDGLEWYDETLLVQAVVGNDAEMIKELAGRGLAINSEDPQSAPLYHASWRGNSAAVAALIELGADVKQPGPLHRAAYHNHPQIARLLLDAGADPTAVDEQGRTPLEAARLHRHVAVIQVLEVNESP
jgi:ankyrin repeat protein